MNWSDHRSYIEICLPKEYNFEECLVFLNRSDQEVLHQVKEGYVFKLIKVEEELVLCKIGCTRNALIVEFPMNPPTRKAREKAALYIWNWFGLDKDLSIFYKMAQRDNVLQPLVHKYDGLRMIGIPDLCEALTWAIIGQQINLSFAYTLKKRFVEKYGECLQYEGVTFWLFPTCEKIAAIDAEELKKLQFTARKAEYIIGLAKDMAAGKITKEGLLKQKDYQQVKQTLMAIRGVGAWTADYVMMKCLHYSSAFPAADAGLHQALKQQLGRLDKPSMEEITKMAESWEGWEAYAVFYLWRSLYEQNA